MAGYVGERARRRKRRIIFIIFLIIISLTIIYFSYSVDDKKNDATDRTVENEQLSIDKEEFELKIIEKEQKIVFRDQRIKSLKIGLELVFGFIEISRFWLFFGEVFNFKALCRHENTSKKHDKLPFHFQYVKTMVRST